MKTRTLTEPERNTLVNGLRVAAERFLGHSQSLTMLRCADCHDRPGKDGLGRTCKTCGGRGEVPDTIEPHVRLRRQFVGQHMDSIALADLIENAENITLEVE